MGQVVVVEPGVGRDLHEVDWSRQRRDGQSACDPSACRITSKAGPSLQNHHRNQPQGRIHDDGGHVHGEQENHPEEGDFEVAGQNPSGLAFPRPAPSQDGGPLGEEYPEPATQRARIDDHRQQPSGENFHEAVLWDAQKEGDAGEQEEQPPVGNGVVGAVPSGTPVGEVPARVAKRLGLPKGVAVVTGGHDQPAGALGAGVTRPGVALDSIGTVECLVISLPKPVLNRKMLNSNFCSYHHTAPGLYVTLAYNFTGGSLLRWYRAGEDAERRLPILSTNLGHVHVADTYWYLSASPELMQEAMLRLEQRWEDQP